MLEGDLDELEAEPRGVQMAYFRECQDPFDDIAKETSWWRCFSSYPEDTVWPDPPLNREFTPREYIKPEPYIAPPKIGRNELCPCGSGKKYKKCCGR